MPSGELQESREAKRVGVEGLRGCGVEGCGVAGLGVEGVLWVSGKGPQGTVPNRSKRYTVRLGVAGDDGEDVLNLLFKLVRS
jgi:hypothetical protein